MWKRENITFPSKYNEVANLIGEARSKLSSDIYQDESERDRGDREGETSFKGVLCELIAREYTKGKGNFFFTPLVEVLGVGDVALPDMMYKGKTYDIKFGGDKYFTVNHKSHNGKKRPDYYWFIRPISETEAESYIFKSEEVDKWELAKAYSSYYRHEVHR